MATRPTSTSSESSTSSRSPPGPPGHHTWTAFSGPVLFTGPSGLRDHRSHLSDHPGVVGTGNRSWETTSDLAYLSRGAPGFPFPRAKNGRIGEIGWSAKKTFQLPNGL